MAFAICAHPRPCGGHRGLQDGVLTRVSFTNASRTRWTFLQAPVLRPWRRWQSSVYNSPKLQEDSPHFSEVTEDTPAEDLDKREGDADASKASIWSRVKNLFKIDKSRLQNLGITAFVAYGFVSNVNFGVIFTVAWLTHVRQTGMIPFARGQWKAFLAVYAGLWAFQNFLRPLRIAAAIALTPLVDHMLDNLVTNLGIKRKQAILLLFCGLAVFTLSSLITGIWILGGIPSSPPKPV